MKRRGSIHVAPPPIGGWNARDPEALMDEKDAVVLDNWFPAESEVTPRKGYEAFVVSGMGSGEIKTLASYEYGTAKKMLACGNGNIYEISTGAASSLASGMTNDAWQTVSFGSRTLLFNGSDTEKSYDGSIVSNAGWTGPTAGTLFTGTVFKSRVYALEKNSQSFWYGGVGAVTGAMTEFDLSQVAGTFGGNISGIGSIALDGGAGVDDLLVIVMSTGDAFVYQGSDPSSDFALIGFYKVGSPIGKRCMMKLGGNLCLITRDGVVDVAKALKDARLGSDYVLSDKIRGAISTSISAYGDTDGWEGLFYPEGNKVIYNVPKSGGYQQYVMNARTGSWCRYTGLNARTWVLHDNVVYFGGTDGKVYKAEHGLNDNGSAIECVGKTSFNFMKNRNQIKLVGGVKINFRSTGQVQVLLTVNTDFKSRAGLVTFYTTLSGGIEWGEAEWDSFEWSGSETTRGKWKLVTGKGYSFQVECRASPKNQRISWQDTSYMYQAAGML
jgi:hypothetical protein